MLRKCLASSAVMQKLTSEENIDKAKGNSQWPYQFYFDLARTTAFEDDRLTKRATETKRNVFAAHGSNLGRGRGGHGTNDKMGRGRGGREGRGDSNSGNDKDGKDTPTDHNEVPYKT